MSGEIAITEEGDRHAHSCHSEDDDTPSDERDSQQGEQGAGQQLTDAPRPLSHSDSDASVSKRCLVMGKGSGLIKQVLGDLGLTCSPGRVSWRVLWSPRCVPLDLYRQLAHYQVVNRMPSSQALTRKDALVANIRRMVKRHGAEHFGMMIPKTFLLPSESERLRNEMITKPNALWIVKPATGSQGRDIRVMKSNSKLTMFGKTNAIVSRYLGPFLIDNRKFDLRLYVVVTCIDPLRVYWHEEGLVRMSTEPYSTDLSQLSNGYVHLTNAAINRNHPDYDDVSELGHKRPLSSLWQLIGPERSETVKLAISSLIAKTFVSVHSVLSNGIQVHVPHRRANQLFELFGFDVLLDNKLHPWLLEVNRSPTLSGASPLDTEIKRRMLSDLFSLVGVKTNAYRPGGGRTQTSMSLAAYRQAIIAEADAEYERRHGWQRVYPRYEPHPRMALAQFFEERQARSIAAYLCNRIAPPANARRQHSDRKSGGKFSSRILDRALLGRVRRKFGMHYAAMR